MKMNDLFTNAQLAEMRKERGNENFGKEEFHTIEKIYEIIPAVKLRGAYSVLMPMRMFRVKATQLLNLQFQRGHVSWVIIGEKATDDIILSAGRTQNGGLERKMDSEYLDQILADFRRSGDCISPLQKVEE